VYRTAARGDDRRHSRTVAMMAMNARIGLTLSASESRIGYQADEGGTTALF